MGEVWITIPACKDPLPVGGDKLPPPPPTGQHGLGALEEAVLELKAQIASHTGLACLSSRRVLSLPLGAPELHCSSFCT